MIIICVIVVAALVLTYVMMFPVNAYASDVTTPPPEDFGTSGDYDDSTLTFPGQEPEEEVIEPMLMITGGPIQLDIGQSYWIPYIMTDFPPGVLAIWESRNPDVAVVTSDGQVLAVGPGDVEITVTAGQKRASVLVTVNDLKANNIIIVVDEEIIKTGPRSYELMVGDVTRFTVRIEPEGAKVEKISWVLGNGNVASLTQSGATAEFIAEGIGSTLLTVKAGDLIDEITINIVESGVPLATIWDYLKYGVIIIIIVVVIIILAAWLAARRKKEKLRQRAIAAKRRKEEAERRAREEAAAYEMKREAREARELREAREPRPAQNSERETMRVSGAAVGAGAAPPVDKKTEIERPLTIDDLE